MKRYVDYEFYKDEYMGKLAEPIFNKHSIGAQAYLDLHTLGRLKGKEEIPIEAKYAICELTERAFKLELSAGKDIASETVASHTIHYSGNNNNKNATNTSDKQSEEYRIVRKWLATTGLMYRGVGKC